MKTLRTSIIARIHLIISVIVVVPVAFIYGFNPSSQFNIFLGTIDEHNFFKAIMCLYIGFAILWTLGIFNKNHLKTALISNLIFMFSLASGRLLSIVTDGVPTQPYVLGTIGEIILGFYGLWVLNSRYIKKH